MPPNTPRVVINGRNDSATVDFLDHGTTVDSRRVQLPGCLDITPGTDHIAISDAHASVTYATTDEQCAQYETLHRQTATATGD